MSLKYQLNYFIPFSNWLLRSNSAWIVNHKMNILTGYSPPVIRCSVLPTYIISLTVWLQNELIHSWCIVPPWVHCHKSPGDFYAMFSSSWKKALTNIASSTKLFSYRTRVHVLSKSLCLCRLKAIKGRIVLTSWSANFVVALHDAKNEPSSREPSKIDFWYGFNSQTIFCHHSPSECHFFCSRKTS